MGDHLGVGLGGEHVALVLELGPQAQVVLHDAVQHDGEAARAVGVRMGVLVGGTAVGGPAGVGHAQRAASSSRSRMASRLSRLPTEWSSSNRPSRDDGDARRVVAPVLELAQTLEEDVPAGTFAHIPDDSAHQTPTSVFTTLGTSTPRRETSRRPPEPRSRGSSRSASPPASGATLPLPRPPGSRQNVRPPAGPARRT